MNFSFFKMKGAAGSVRAIQMSEILGGKLNPESGYENDLCIYVKVIPLNGYPKHSYMDVVDAPRATEWLKSHPDMGVIAISPAAKDYLEKVLKRKDIIFIPHHHCNYERFQRPERPVKTVGIIGSSTSFQYPIEKIRPALRELGLELFYKKHFRRNFHDAPDENGINGRDKVIRFLKEVDIQIVYRLHAWSPMYEPYRNPLKLENAGSFGIPTVAFPEPNYVREFDGCFIQAKTIDELLMYCKRLKEDSVFYKYYANKGRERAEEYHIDKIKQMYLQLP